MNKIYVPGKGNGSAKIAIIGEAPANMETEQLTPFVGASGQLLNAMLKEIGISREECWLTNVCKYQIPPNLGKQKIPFRVRAESIGINVDEEVSNLRKELLTIRPNILILLGGSALYECAGKSPIQKWRGSIISAFGIKAISTYHPSHILHQEGDVKGYWNKSIMKFDLKRAVKQSYFPEIQLPYRNLNICTSPSQFYDFIHRNRFNSNPAIDIEAFKCIPICIGISFIPGEGITIPLWNHHNISSLSNQDLAILWSMLSEFLAKHRVIGQNFNYDRDKIKRLGFIVKSLYSDTMLKAFSINPEFPKNLAFNTSIYTEEPYYKDEGMYEGKVSDLLIGCARDACITQEINTAMDPDLDELGVRPYYEKFLLPLYNLYGKIENIGFKVDESLRKETIIKYIEWDEQIRYKLYKIVGCEVNASSPKQITNLLYENWKLPFRGGTGEEVLTQLLNQNVKSDLHRKGIELILEDRQVKKTLSSYLYAPTDFDGRMKTSYFICLETGRSATQQQDPPLRPQVEVRDEYGHRKKQSIGMAFQTITKHGEIGPEVRRIFVPDEGEIFLQADSSQAEARVIFLLAEDYEALEDIDKRDYHAYTASWFLGGSEEQHSKKAHGGKESPERFLGKTLRHAGHLGASKRRAALEVNTQARKYKIPIVITEAIADKALKVFHAKQPKIKQIFQEGIRKCIEKDRKLIAPSPYGIDCGAPRIFYERYGEDLFRQGFSYIPQRTVSENTKGVALRISGSMEYGITGRASWIKIIVESHDALLVSVPINRRFEAANILREEFERPINFSKCSLPRGQLIIPCEIESGYNYKDLSKFKWLVEE